jgi:uncharacterized protein (TIGR02996 family)
MNTEKGFLADIVQHPNDDAPRLVYADWLDEHGNPDLASFIRVQCALARLPDGCPGRVELEEQEHDLEGLHGAAWGAALGPGVCEPQFRRGLVEVASMTARSFVRRAGKLYRMTPLRRLRVKVVGPDVRVPVDRPYRPNLARRDCRDQVAILEHLLTSPYLAHLEALDLTHARFGDAGAFALAACPHLRNLSVLVLDRTGIGDDGLTALAASPTLARLTMLTLSGNEVGEKGAQALANSPYLGRLEALDLSRNQLGDVGATALGRSAHLGALRRVALVGNGIGLEGLRALLSQRPQGAITAVDLTANDIGDVEAEAISTSPGLNHLTALYLGECWIEDDGARALAQSARASRLELLNLSGNRIGDTGANALAASAHLGHLAELDISDNRIGATGATALWHSTSLGQLRELDLAFNQIPRPVVLDLASQRGARHACRIDLMGNPDDGTPTGQERPRPSRRGLSSAAFARREKMRLEQEHGTPCFMTGPEGWTWPW